MGAYAVTLASMFPTIAARKPLMAGLAYLAALIGLLLTAAWIGTALWAESLDNAELRDRLAQLDARVAALAPNASGKDSQSGSPFIEGATITQAGATLQQRVGRAVVKAGGSLLSSQVDLEDQQARPGAIALSADLDIPQAALQGFLYDIEAGMPYLFVDTLSVQLPRTAGDQETSRMHVSIGVSGQWEGRP